MVNESRKKPSVKDRAGHVMAALQILALTTFISLLMLFAPNRVDGETVVKSQAHHNSFVVPMCIGFMVLAVGAVIYTGVMLLVARRHSSDS